MPNDITEINTDTRAEMVCSHCWTKGLEESVSYAEHCEDNRAQKIVYATSCPNAGCPNHDNGQSDPSRVNPDDIKQQYSSGLGGGFTSSLSGILSGFSRTHIAGTLAVVLLVAAFATMGGLFLMGGSGPADTAAPGDDGNQTSALSDEYPYTFDGVSGRYKVVAQNGDWRIFGSANNTYVVADTNESDRRFVTASGRVIDSAVVITGFSSAKDALNNLLGDSEFDRLSTQHDGIQLVNDSYRPVATDGNWVIYQTGNGDYVVGGMFNGKAKFLTPSGELSYSPSYFSSEFAAENALEEWQTANNGGPDGTLGDNPTSYSDWQIFSYDGGYVVAGDYGDYTVYLYPDGSISKEPYVYDNVDAATGAIFTYESISADLTDSEYEEQFVFDISSETTTEKVKGDLTSPTFGDDYEFDPDLDSDGSSDSEYYGHGGDDWNCENCGDSDGGPDGTETDSGTESGYTADNSQNLNGSENEGTQSDTNVNGRVTNSSGEPVENATVHLYSKHYTTTTDADGYYQFTNIPTGIHKIHVEPPESSQMAATANTTINVTEGGLQVVNETDSVQYFEYQGKVAENTLDFRPPQARPIQGSGSGSAITTRFNLKNPRNADDISVTLEPAYSGATRSLSQEGNSVTKTLTIDSDKAPTNQKLSLSGLVTREAVSVSGKDSSTLTIEGNYPARSAVLEVEGSEKTTTKEVDGSSTSGIQNNGNLDGSATVTIEGGPETTNEKSVSGSGEQTVTNDGTINGTMTLTVEGSEASSGRTVGGTGDGTVTNNGNVDTNATFTVEGAETTTDRTVSHTGTGTISNNGNVEVQADATIQGDTRLSTVQKNGSIEDGEIITINVDGTDSARNVQLTLTGKNEVGYEVASGRVKQNDGDYKDITSEELEGGKTYRLDVDPIVAYAKGGDYSTSFSATAKVKQSGGETIIKRHNGCSWRTTPCDYVDKNTTSKIFTAEGSGSQTFYISAETYTSDDDDCWAECNYGAEVDYDFHRVYDTGDTFITVDGSQVGSTYLEKGETKTINLGDLEPGQHTITIDTESAGVDYDASWDEVTETTDISMDTDGDGTAEFTRSDPLGSGETATTTLTLSPSDTQIAVNNNGPTPSWSASFTEVTATQNLNADLNGNGSDDISHDGPLGEGESVSKTVTLTPGDSAVSLQHGGPTPSWSASFTEVAATQNLNADLNGNGSDEIDVSGPLRSGETRTRKVTLPPGETTVQMSYGGPAPTWSGTLTETMATDNLNADLNGDGADEIVMNSVLREGDTVTETVQLGPGSHEVSVNSQGPQPTWSAQVTENYATEDPTVQVGESAAVSEAGLLRDGETKTVPISQLESGEQSVQVSATAGPNPSYELNYVAQAVPENIMVTVNGDEYRYPEDFNSEGKLSTYSKASIDSLKNGENTIAVDVSQVNGVEPRVEQNVEFQTYGDQSADPEIILLTPSGSVHTRTVPDSALSNGKLQEQVTVPFPQQVFESGEHIVIVRTPDNSNIQVSVSGTAAEYQGVSFQPVSNTTVATELP